VHDAMRLSPVGAIADVLWYEIKNHAKNIELDVYQVMPNHFHGILILNNDPSNNNKNDVDTGHALYLQSQSHGNSNDPENLKTSEHSNKTIGQQRFQNQGKNTLSSIVGGYKSAVPKHANRLGLDFAWQSRFYDHIIRDNESYERIRNYIVNNPRKWDEDKFRK
jgi:REP element-mobilizing transposase RayT